MKTYKEKEQDLKQAKRDVKRAKQQLKRQADRNGMWENFGQTNIRKLEDKYHYPTYNNPELDETLSDFREWCMNYVPKD